MRRPAAVAGAVLLCAALVPLAWLIAMAFDSTQAVTKAQVFANIGTGFSWSGSAQPAWSGDNTVLNKTTFATFVSNSGSCGGDNGNYVLSYSQMQQCATNSSPVVHTPILANNTFTGGLFSSWSDTATTYSVCGSGATTFSGIGASDQDGDSGYAQGGSGVACTGGAKTATVGYTQTFTISGTPTSQSYSVYYNATQAIAGDAVNCTQGTGTVTNLIVKIDGVPETTVASPTLDGAWHQVSGSTSDLANGSNTFEVDVTLSGATGTRQNPTICSGIANTSQTLSLDVNKVTATW